MSSIEDILNASDSEDDNGPFESKSIDLEELLNSNDDDDDNDFSLFPIHHKLANEPSVVIESSTCNKCTPSEAITKSGKASELDGVAVAVAEPTSPTSNEDILRLYASDEGEYMGGEDTAESLDSSYIKSRGDTSSLEQAELREKRFLSASRKESVSALQAKRNKNIITLYSNIKCSELLTISTHLRRNASYKAHGPGSATALAVHRNYLAIGTSKGLIIIFDHQEQIRYILGSATSLVGGTLAGSSANSSNSNGGSCRPESAVTAMDTGSPLGSVLVCGYASGEIALWETSRGTLLKIIHGLHNSPVTFAAFVRCCGEDEPIEVSGSAGSSPPLAAATIISADAQGVLHRTKLSRSMVWSALSVESDCLLDGSSGLVAGCAILAPLSIQYCPTHLRVPLRNRPTAAGTTAGTAALSPFLLANGTAQYLAINVGMHSWIVQAGPVLAVLHKWKAPVDCFDVAPTAGASQPAAAGVSSTSSRLIPGLTCCIDWGWVDMKSQLLREQVRRHNSLREVGAEGQQADEQPKPAWQPALARSWGGCVEILSLGLPAAAAAEHSSSSSSSSSSATFSFLHSSSSGTATAHNAAAAATVHKPVFTVLHQTKLLQRGRVLGLRWLQTEQLVLLTEAEVIVMNPTLTTTEQFLLTPVISQALQLQTATHEPPDSKSRSSSSVCGHGGHGTAVHTASAGSRLFISAGAELALQVQVRSCFELAEELVGAGQWLEALALVLEHTSSAPALLQSHRYEVDRLIVAYVELAVKQPAITSIAAAAHLPTAGAALPTTQNRNHYHLVAGVCIEYCIASEALPLLFGRLFDLFTAARQQAVFLESLEPYILSEQIGALPAHVMQQFCESAQRLERLPSVERCFTHLEVRLMERAELALVVRFLLEHRMLSGLLYALSCGLRDFPAAAHWGFHLLQAETDSELRAELDAAVQGAEGAFSEELRLSLVRLLLDSPPAPQEADAAYKILLFLRYTCQGKVFPRGTPCSAPSESSAAAASLLTLLCGRRLGPPPDLLPSTSDAEQDGSGQGSRQRQVRDVGARRDSVSPRLYDAMPFPYLLVLSRVDPEALFCCLAEAVAVVQSELAGPGVGDLGTGTETGAGLGIGTGRDANEQGNFLVGDTPFGVPRVDKVEGDLCQAFDQMTEFCTLVNSVEVRGSHISELFYERFLPLIVRCPCRLSAPFMDRLIGYCGSRPPETHRHYEDLLTLLMHRQARFALDNGAIRRALRNCNFWIASLLAKRSVVGNASAAPKLHYTDYRQALQFYISISSEELPVRAGESCGRNITPVPAASATTAAAGLGDCEDHDADDDVCGEEHLVFVFIRAQASQLQGCVDRGEEGAEEQLREIFPSELLGHLEQLCHVSLPSTKRIARLYLSDRATQLLEASRHDARMQFELLDALVDTPARGDWSSSGGGTPGTRSASRYLLSLGDLLDPSSLLCYFNLLCRFAPARVLNFLATHEEHYPVEEFLLICKDQGLSEATAFLMEKMGDTTEALSLLLKDVSQRLKSTRRDIDAQLRAESQLQQSGAGGERSVVSQILSSQGQQRAELASRLLPSYPMLASLLNCAADLCSRHTNDQAVEGMWFFAFDHLLQERYLIRTGTLSSSGEVVIVVIGLLLQLLMSRMQQGSTIMPQDIIRRVTAQGHAAGMRLGEFKDVVTSMLGSNMHEMLQHSAISSAIFADLVEIHKQKMHTMRKFCYRGGVGSVPARLRGLLGAPSHPAWEEEQEEEREEQDGGSGPVLLGDADPTAMLAAGTAEKSRRPLPIPWRKRNIKSDFKKWKVALDTRSAWQVCTAVPADGEALFAGELEARRPGSLDAVAAYVARVDLPGRS